MTHLKCVGLLYLPVLGHGEFCFVYCHCRVKRQGRKNRAVPCPAGPWGAQSPPLPWELTLKRQLKYLASSLPLLPLLSPRTLSAEFKDSLEAAGLAARRLDLSTYQWIFDSRLENNHDLRNFTIQLCKSGLGIRCTVPLTQCPVIFLLYCSMARYLVACPLRPFLLPSKVHNLGYCLTSYPAPLWPFPIPTVLQGCPRECYSCALSGGDCIPHRTIHKPGWVSSSAVSESQGILPWGHQAGWKRGAA